MPKLVRLYIQSVAIGFAMAAGFTGLLVWQDVAGIGRLILGSGQGWIAALMLVLFHGVIFASVQFAIRVMMMAEDNGKPRGGLRQHLMPDLTPIPVKVEAKAASQKTALQKRL